MKKTSRNGILLASALIFAICTTSTTFAANLLPKKTPIIRQNEKQTSHNSEILPRVSLNLPNVENNPPSRMLRTTETTLPALWNPINSKSENYKETTPVRNQGELGICWAYSGSDLLSEATLSSIGSERSYSPNLYNYLCASNAFTGGVKNPTTIMMDSSTPRKLNDGAPLDYVGTMTMLGFQPVLESTFSTPEIPSSVQPMSESKYKGLSKQDISVNDVINIASGTLNTDSNGNLVSTPTTSEKAVRLQALKQAIYTYGALQFGIYAESCVNDTENPESNTYGLSVFNQKNSASYIPITTTNLKQNGTVYDGTYSLNLDHAVAIVGWDDNYNKNNFSQKPSENGAFVVKNSWSSEWGDEGYYYVSYEDLYVYASEALAVNVNEKKEEHLYSYVNTSYNNAFLFGSGDLSNNTILANVFHASSNATIVETLDAISFYTLQSGVKVDVLYAPVPIKDNNGGNDTTNFQTLASNVILTQSGFQKIPLTKSVVLPSGKDFTIAVRITNASFFDKFGIPFQSIENATNGTQVYPICPAGRSFYSSTSVGSAPSFTGVSSNSAYQVNFYLNAYATPKDVDLKYTKVNEEKVVKSSSTKLYKAPYVNGLENIEKGNAKSLGVYHKKVTVKELANTGVATYAHIYLGSTDKGWINANELQSLSTTISTENVSTLYSVQKNYTLYQKAYVSGVKHLGSAKQKKVYQETVEVKQIVTNGYGSYAKLFVREKTGGKFTKYIGWINLSALSKKYLLKSETKFVKKNWVVASKSGTFWNKPYVIGAKKLHASKTYYKKKVIIYQKAVVDSTTYYKCYYKGKSIGWINSHSLRK